VNVEPLRMLKREVEDPCYRRLPKASAGKRSVPAPSSDRLAPALAPVPTGSIWMVASDVGPIAIPAQS
jgi:hypothetical protein